MEATTTVDKPAIDRDVERLVHEIGEVIEKARPEERETASDGKLSDVGSYWAC